MKKLVLLIGLGIILLPNVSFAKLERAITTDPVDFINFRKINVKYEQMLERKKSFTVELFYDNNFQNTMGIGIGGAYRWYFRPYMLKTVGVEGLSAAPYARIGWYRKKPNPAQYDNQAGMDFGGEVAYKIILGGNFAIEPMIRMGYGIGGEVFANNKGFKPYPGVSIGYAW